ncbi:carbohydrate porin [Microcoleus sp. FACHB-1515]|uniref:carbohydrate porin n=1 Tax=Cyanophyceae TaxID=3028117 RepID=UPI00168A3765|nr:carbohydrate porin [Microcoleus sp. FACHB-1515]MBD2091542.1 carbohydrate porin [Microcoleus sp. FACHB-1515]
MNRKSSVPWLRPLLGTASTSLLICILSVPAQAESNPIALDSILPDDQPIASNEALEALSATDSPEGEAIASLPKAADLAAIESKEIADSVVPTSADSLAADAIAPDVIPAASIAPTVTQPEIAESVPTAIPATSIAPTAMEPDRVAQRSSEPQPEPASQQASDLVGEPLVRAQGAIVVQGDDTSARARLTAEYAINPNLLIGTTIDLTTGNAFVDSESEGFNINELYVAASPEGLPGLRFVAGMVDLTSYFDRNSFAKDGVTHFFNPVFQTNPALAATGIGSRPSALVIWQVNDSIEVKAATFSSSRNLDEFAFDGFAGELGVRLGDLIVRGTFSSDRDDGQNDGFREIFGFDRGNGNFGLESDDREQAYGINAEWWIPSANLGLFGRYGRYENLELDRGGDTFSFGFNLLDLFMTDDRLGLAYGRQLSNSDLRQAENAAVPDVLELFYDARISPNLRAGISFQQRDAFSETVLGFRIRADFDLLGGR